MGIWRPDDQYPVYEYQTLTIPVFSGKNWLDGPIIWIPHLKSIWILGYYLSDIQMALKNSTIQKLDKFWSFEYKTQYLEPHVIFTKYLLAQIIWEEIQFRDMSGTRGEIRQVKKFATLVFMLTISAARFGDLSPFWLLFEPFGN